MNKEEEGHLREAARGLREAGKELCSVREGDVRERSLFRQGKPGGPHVTDVVTFGPTFQPRQWSVVGLEGWLKAPRRSQCVASQDSAGTQGGGSEGHCLDCWWDGGGEETRHFPPFLSPSI